MGRGCALEALSCKLGWCFVTSDAIVGQKVEDHPTFIAIAKLRTEAKTLGLSALGFRESFEEVFHDRSNR